MSEFTKSRIRRIPTDWIGAYLHQLIFGSEVLCAYAGRSDTSMHRRQLEQHKRGIYNHLTLFPCDDVRGAFEKECELYHSISDTLLQNERHPGRPVGLSCPWCFSIEPSKEEEK